MVNFQIKGASLPLGKQAALGAALQETSSLLHQAEQLRQQRKFDRAQTICESLLQRYPDYMGALHTLGLVFGDQDKYELALDCLVRAVMLNPRSWMTLTALSGVYLRLGANEMAAKTLAQARSIKPQDANLLVALGDIYRAEREYELARDTYRQAVALDRSLVPAAIGLGWCYENLGENAEAAKTFESLIKRGMRLIEPIRALSNLPASVVNIDLMAAVERVVRDPSEEKDDFESSVAFFRAVALDRAGRHAAAWTQLSAANQMVFRTVQKSLAQLSDIREASLATLRAHPGKVGHDLNNAGGWPISLFIVGPSGCGKTTMERLIGELNGVKRGFENPIVEKTVRRTFQSSNLLTVSRLEFLPPQLYPLCREVYQEEVVRRCGSARVFTNTLSACVYDAARIVSVFPNVRFIFVRRNMEDNILRIFMRKYREGNAYSYDLKAARDHLLWYGQMTDLMLEKFPNITRIINYEDMVANTSAALGTAAALCGLPMPVGTPPTIVGDCGCATPYRQFIADGLGR